ncbi:MAG: hypothetical protein AB1813_27960 [Verrucomicrobiota bacterium]|jgi:hypothetical protein
MKPEEVISSLWQAPVLTRRRMQWAFLIAIAADAAQLMLGPAGFFIFDEVIDVAAMALTISLLGFHWLLLPTFVLELFPVVDMLPTWTGCVALVIAMRKRGGPIPPEPPPLKRIN